MIDKKRVKRPPVLFIGCGGTGFKVVKEVYKKMKEEFGEQLDDKLVEFLVIDTHSGEFYDDETNFPQEDFFSLGPIQLDRFLNNEYEYDELIKSWFDKNQYACLMATGAMQVRAFGRYALFAKVKDVYNIINKKINKLISKIHTQTQINDLTSPLNIHIVGNIGGGTGSGIMLDVAYLLKFITFKPTVVFGHLITPDYITDIQLKDSLYANAYAFLKELDNFNQNPDIYINFSPIIRYYYKQVEQDAAFEKISKELKTSPFDYIFLLSPFTKDFHFHEEQSFLEVVSERLFLSTFSEVTDREMARLVNITDVLNNIYKDKKIKKGKLCRYSSYGVTTFNFREEYLENLIKKVIVRKLGNMVEELEKEKLKIIEIEKSKDAKKKIIQNLEKFHEDFSKKIHELGSVVKSISGEFNPEAAKKKISKGDISFKDIIEKDIDKIIENFLNENIRFFKVENLKTNFSEDFIVEQLILWEKDIYKELKERISKVKKILDSYKQSFITPIKKSSSTFQYVFINMVPDRFLDEFFEEYLSFFPSDMLKELLKISNEKEIEKFFKTTIDNFINKFKSDTSGKFNIRELFNSLDKKYPQDSQDIIEITLEFASPCWQYNDYYDSYVKTIAIIGCKSDHELYEKLKHRNFYKATLEATDTEEDPLDIPLLISQHGLPLRGYELLKKYKISYDLMKDRFQNSKLKKQLHLDKRWEEEDNDILIDPFYDYPDSYVKFYYDQLFVFAWFTELIYKDTLNRFFFKYKTEQEDIEFPLSIYSNTLKSALEIFRNRMNNNLEEIIIKEFQSKIEKILATPESEETTLLNIFNQWADKNLHIEEEKSLSQAIQIDNIIKKRLNKLFKFYIQYKYRTLMELDIDNFREFYRLIKDEI